MQTATITSIKREFNLLPNIVGIITTADLAAITSADYFANESDNIELLNNGVWQWELQDIVLIYYSSDQIGWFKYDATNSTFVAIGGVSFSPSNPAWSTVASVISPGAIPISNLAVFQDAEGSIGDSGINIVDVQLSANIEASVTNDLGGGGAGPITVSDPRIAANSVVVGNVFTSSNPVSILSITPASGSFDILFSGDPGAACRVSYVAFIASQ